MDEIDEMEAEVHRVLDALDCDPAIVEMMRALWMQQLQMERQRRAQSLH